MALATSPRFTAQQPQQQSTPAPLQAPSVPPAPVLRDQAAQLSQMVTAHLGGGQ